MNLSLPHFLQRQPFDCSCQIPSRERLPVRFKSTVTASTSCLFSHTKVTTSLLTMNTSISYFFNHYTTIKHLRKLDKKKSPFNELALGEFSVFPGTNVSSLLCSGLFHAASSVWYTRQHLLPQTGCIIQPLAQKILAAAGMVKNFLDSL